MAKKRPTAPQGAEVTPEEKPAELGADGVDQPEPPSEVESAEQLAPEVAAQPVTYVSSVDIYRRGRLVLAGRHFVAPADVPPGPTWRKVVPTGGATAAPVMSKKRGADRSVLT